ncbi:serine hydrolase [Fischerella thermalis]|uniref:Beta-lactamase n=1 Tax=Fischerella thermalis JSC-11 TaxID=741277 RepID=G6FSV8_9CYAN|nr:serine hydrolase [Fischerella thermalis]PMB04152.1 serine hydrolase [Fischerella thermalis CCMEE 5328]EHC14944.1 beta-lactamase [Fischerella thermalis JSC-11]PLZ05877.1 serine hydrolase [Fischerella thermalis WC114]PLZ20929.1 serine hydrolase [Fischerella thermalis WC157]PLZ62237.1 serine hydrolase [Fischerella thermalis WC249]
MRLRFLLLSVVSIVLLSSPIKAAQLQSWSFDQARNQLHLTTDSGVQPRAFLIKNPTRLVLDLPGTNLNRDTVRQSFGSAIKEIRIGQVDSKTTRMVIELAPGYTVSPDKLLIKGDSSSHWIVNFSSIERVTANNSFEQSANNKSNEEQFPIQIGDASSFVGGIRLGKDISQLNTQVKGLMARYSYLQPGMFFLDLDTGNYLDLNGEKIFPAASTIKFPILVALFEEVDAGRIKLNETLVMRRDLMTGGSGTLQYKRPGTKLSVLETATKMITISDNTATNMIIDRLGGKAKLNQRFRSWGLQNTVIRNLLGDFKGTNTTSAKDLVRLGALLANNQLLSDTSRSKTLDIMRRVENRSLLPAGLGKGAVIAHKTGTLGIILGDAGIIQTSTGKRYLAGIMVRRPFGDKRAKSFINQVSRLVYSYIEQNTINASSPPPQQL